MELPATYPVGSHQAAALAVLVHQAALRSSPILGLLDAKDVSRTGFPEDSATGRSACAESRASPTASLAEGLLTLQEAGGAAAGGPSGTVEGESASMSGIALASLAGPTQFSSVAFLTAYRATLPAAPAAAPVPGKAEGGTHWWATSDLLVAAAGSAELGETGVGTRPYVPPSTPYFPTYTGSTADGRVPELVPFLSPPGGSSWHERVRQGLGPGGWQEQEGGQESTVAAPSRKRSRLPTDRDASDLPLALSLSRGLGDPLTPLSLGLGLGLQCSSTCMGDAAAGTSLGDRGGGKGSRSRATTMSGGRSTGGRSSAGGAGSPGSAASSSSSSSSSSPSSQGQGQEGGTGRRRASSFSSQAGSECTPSAPASGAGKRKYSAQQGGGGEGSEVGKDAYVSSASALAWVSGRTHGGHFDSKDWAPGRSKFSCIYRNDTRWALCLKGKKFRFGTRVEADLVYELECLVGKQEVGSKVRRGWGEVNGCTPERYAAECLSEAQKAYRHVASITLFDGSQYWLHGPHAGTRTGGHQGDTPPQGALAPSFLLSEGKGKFRWPNIPILQAVAGAPAAVAGAPGGM